MIVYNRVSKVIFVWFGLRFTTLCDCVAKLVPIFQPMRNKSKTNRGLLARRRFPALDTDYMSVASSSDWFVALFAFVVIGSSFPFVCRNGSDYALVYAYKYYEFDSSRVGLLLRSTKENAP